MRAFWVIPALFPTLKRREVKMKYEVDENGILTKDEIENIEDDFYPSSEYYLDGGWNIIESQRYALLKAQHEADKERAADQRRKETATEIGGWLCILIGNKMLEDMESGKLLASQLDCVIKQIKSHYGIGEVNG
jgi:hypothetical protein